jgi:serine phosphatase RsbU (regulator of sigma subunit)
MKKALLLLYFSLFYFLAFGQGNTIFHIDSIPPQGILLDKNWKFKVGDNPDFAKPDFEDSDWESIDPTLQVIDTLYQIPRPSGICWFRIKLKINDKLSKNILAFATLQSGASEVYINGNLSQKYGYISSNPDEIKAYDPIFDPIPFYIQKDTVIVLAIRYTLQPHFFHSELQYPALSLTLNTLEAIQSYKAQGLNRFYTSNVFRIGAFLILLISYFALYIYYPIQKANLFFCLFSLSLLLADLIQLKVYNHHWVEERGVLNILFHILLTIGKIFLLTAVYRLMAQKTNWLYWLLLGLVFLGYLMNVFFNSLFFIFLSIHVFPNLVDLDIIRITLKSIQSKKSGAWIITVGGIVFLISTVVFVLSIYLNFINTSLFGSIHTVGDLVYNISWLCIPVSVSIYFGLEVSSTNKFLGQKLIEVQTLSSEKQQILENQKIELEKQVTERTIELKESNEELAQTNVALNYAFHQIEKKNEDITASINAALRIQNAMLPVPARFKSAFGKENYFVLFKPRDIVSGDFYFLGEATFPPLEGGGGGEKIVLVCADCTGHGVPGAFMSMIGNQILTEIVGKEQITDPDQILNLLNKEINKVLKQNENQGREGMDVAVVTFTKKTNLVCFGNPQGFDKVEYAGAMNPIYYIQNGELKEIKADKKPIGGIQEEEERTFTKHTIELGVEKEQLQTSNSKPQTILYLCSDGFQDQFGGAQGKKFMVKRFRELLFSIHHLPMHEQRQILDDTIESWMAEGNEHQIDDILVMGIKV